MAVLGERWLKKTCILWFILPLFWGLGNPQKKNSWEPGWRIGCFYFGMYPQVNGHRTPAEASLQPRITWVSWSLDRYPKLTARKLIQNRSLLHCQIRIHASSHPPIREMPHKAQEERFGLTKKNKQAGWVKNFLIFVNVVIVLLFFAFSSSHALPSFAAPSLIGIIPPHVSSQHDLIHPWHNLASQIVSIDSSLHHGSWCSSYRWGHTNQPHASHMHVDSQQNFDTAYKNSAVTPCDTHTLVAIFLKSNWPTKSKEAVFWSTKICISSLLQFLTHQTIFSHGLLHSGSSNHFDPYNFHFAKDPWSTYFLIVRLHLNNKQSFHAFLSCKGLTSKMPLQSHIHV